MDQVTRLALKGTNQIATLKTGRVVHVDGLPCELLDDVEVYSATGVADETAATGGEPERASASAKA